MIETSTFHPSTKRHAPDFSTNEGWRFSKSKSYILRLNSKPYFFFSALPCMDYQVADCKLKGVGAARKTEMEVKMCALWLHHKGNHLGHDFPNSVHASMSLRKHISYCNAARSVWDGRAVSCHSPLYALILGQKILDAEGQYYRTSRRDLAI